MKKIACIVLALVLCLLILFYVKADVNHGHGPEYINEQEIEENTHIEGGH